MKRKTRIASILKANSLDFSITGIPTFNLSALHLLSTLDFELPTNIRLGHLAERIVSKLIESSTNYQVIYENIQVIENKTTIGEIDFIIEEIKTKQLTHVELAYKFYLFDPSISSLPLNNWIGPNRNDSLKDKLEKLKRKQFPLLHHNSSKAAFKEIDINQVDQALCLLVSLFVPYESKTNFNPSYEKAIKGYYLNLDTFIGIHNSAKTYSLPIKKEWGMDPSENENWLPFNTVENFINICMEEKQAPLVWQKHKDSYIAFFIVWW
jgi:hypothetical protein